MKVFLFVVVIAGVVFSAQAEDKLCVDERELPMCVDATVPKVVQKKLVADCLRCFAEATALSVAPGGSDVCVPKCKNDANQGNKKTDFFEPVQTCKGEVWCVDQFGHEFNNSRKAGNESDIDCTSFLAAGTPVKTACEISKGDAEKNSEDYIPQCNTDGSFAQKQCYGKTQNKPWCWCSLNNGKYVVGTFHASTEADTCAQHYAASYNCGDLEGLKKHPFDCERYVNCGPRIYTCKCPKGQAFNPKLKICDWKQNVNCS